MSVPRLTAGAFLAALSLVVVALGEQRRRRLGGLRRERPVGRDRHRHDGRRLDGGPLPGEPNRRAREGDHRLGHWDRSRCAGRTKRHPSPRPRGQEGTFPSPTDELRHIRVGMRSRPPGGSRPTSCSASPLPAPSRAVSKLGAARLMLDVVKKEKVEIVTLGPLTNIADTHRKSPTFASRVTGITLMGGALKVAGNVQGSKAEWNLRRSARDRHRPSLGNPVDARPTRRDKHRSAERHVLRAARRECDDGFRAVRPRGDVERGTSSTSCTSGIPSPPRCSSIQLSRRSNGERFVSSRPGPMRGGQSSAGETRIRTTLTGQPHGVRGPLSRHAERVSELARPRSGGLRDSLPAITFWLPRTRSPCRGFVPR